MNPILLPAFLLLFQAAAIPDGISEGPTAAFYAGILAAVWAFERAASYWTQFKKPAVTAAAIAKAVKEELTSAELAAMKLVVSDALEEHLETIGEQVSILYEWHDREDPDRPGWKIWWVSSRDFKKLLEVAERQTELDKELLRALDRREELDRLLIATLETIQRSSALAASKAETTNQSVGLVLSKLATLNRGDKSA